MPKKITDPTSKTFVNYLDNLGISAKSLKNYRSDLNHFLGWIILKLRSFGTYVQNLTEIIPFLTTEVASEYKIFMTENSIARKTINRRLSTLRHLSRFLLESQILDFDFMDNVTNVTYKQTLSEALMSLTSGFQTHLEAGKATQEEIEKNLNDIKDFIVWLERHENQQTKTH